MGVFRIQKFKNHLKSEKFLPTLHDTTYDAYLNELKQVLLGFDWKQHQHFLNTFKPYKTEIEGLKIHSLRVSTPPKDKKTIVIPLLILHGFPGSFWDFFKVNYLNGFFPSIQSNFRSSLSSLIQRDMDSTLVLRNLFNLM